jgi:putative redox protein
VATQRVTLNSRGNTSVFDAAGGDSGGTITVGRRAADDTGEPIVRAMELILMGLGTCLGGTLRGILNKKRIPISGLTLTIEADRSEEGPMAFRSVHVSIEVVSEALDPANLAKAVALAEKNCSAHATLAHGVPITAAGKVVAQA